MDSISLPLEPYAQQQARLPTTGRHFIAHTSSSSTAELSSGCDTVVVYQAYKPSIATAAVERQCLTASADFSTKRMTWVKPGFMWMMYRSGWASKQHQERILAFHIRKPWLLDTLKAKSILSIRSNTGQTKDKDVVVQWDPDHDVQGNKLDRRSIQMGLRGAAAAEYAAGTAGPAVVKIEDITPYVCLMRDTVVNHQQQQQQQQQVSSMTEPAELQEASRAKHEVAAAAAVVAAVARQLLVPVEEVLELDDELQTVLGMGPHSVDKADSAAGGDSITDQQ